MLPKCNGKLTYAGRKTAQQAVKDKSRGNRMRVYRCDDCGYFHLTTLTDRNVLKKPKRRTYEHENQSCNPDDWE